VTQSDLTPLLRNGPSLFERNQFETLSFGFRAYFDLLTLLIAQPIGGETTVVEFPACGDQVEEDPGEFWAAAVIPLGTPGLALMRQ